MSHDTFSKIPTLILENENLSPSDKLIYAVIYGFKSNENCWASNEYFSKKISISIGSVKRSLDNLEKFGFIIRETTQVGAIRNRQIILNKNNEVHFGPTEVQFEPSGVQSEPRTRSNLIVSEVQFGPSIDNIINKVIDNTNNTANKKTSKSSSKKKPIAVIPTEPEDLILEPHLDTKEVRESLIEWLAYKKEKRQSYKPIGFKSFMKKTHEDYQDPITLIKSIENAMSKNWDGVYKIKDGLDRAKKYLSRAEQNQEYLKASMARAKQLQAEGQAEIDAGIEQLGFFDNYNPLDKRN